MKYSLDPPARKQSPPIYHSRIVRWSAGISAVLLLAVGILQFGGPARQTQAAPDKPMSLAEAASQPVGNGRQTDKPAAALTSDHKHDIAPSEVVANPKNTGVLSNGCFADYGKPGTECLAVAKVSTKPTCPKVREVFPDGIVVAGTDRFALDTNKDGIACNKADG